MKAVVLCTLVLACALARPISISQAKVHQDSLNIERAMHADHVSKDVQAAVHRNLEEMERDAAKLAKAHGHSRAELKRAMKLRMEALQDQLHPDDLEEESDSDNDENMALDESENEQLALQNARHHKLEEGSEDSDNDMIALGDESEDEPGFLGDEAEGEFEEDEDEDEAGGDDELLPDNSQLTQVINTGLRNQRSMEEHPTKRYGSAPRAAMSDLSELRIQHPRVLEEEEDSEDSEDNTALEEEDDDDDEEEDTNTTTFHKFKGQWVMPKYSMMDYIKHAQSLPDAKKAEDNENELEEDSDSGDDGEGEVEADADADSAESTESKHERQPSLEERVEKDVTATLHALEESDLSPALKSRASENAKQILADAKQLPGAKGEERERLTRAISLRMKALNKEIA